MANATAVVPPAWPTKHTQDHTKKMFWAFFGPMFSSKKSPRKCSMNSKVSAEHIHTRRPRGVVRRHRRWAQRSEQGDLAGGGGRPDRSRRSAELGLASTEGDGRRTEATKEDLEIQNWFLAANEDEEKSKRSSSRISRGLNSLNSGGDARRWIEWLKRRVRRCAVGRFGNRQTRIGEGGAH